MKKASLLRRSASALLLTLTASLILVSCSSTRKYGCPNHVNGASSYSSR